MSYSKNSPAASSPHSVSRAQLSRATSYTVTPPGLTRVFSAQHLDDVSTYHGDDHGSNYDDEKNESVFSDEPEHLKNDNDDEAVRQSQDEVLEARTDVPNTQDLEASLEKKQSIRSVKHPNLVQRWTGAR